MDDNIPSSPLGDLSINDAEFCPNPSPPQSPSPSMDYPQSPSETNASRPQSPGPLESESESDSSGTYTIDPPPEAVYDSYKLALEAVHSFSKGYGYEISVRKSLKKNKRDEAYKKLLRCTRGGKLRNTRKLTDETRVRLNRGSKVTGCPMGLILVADDAQDITGKWRIVHQQGEKSRRHNHHPVNCVALPGHRRRARTERIQAEIQQQQAASISVSRTLATLKQRDPTLPITRKDVDNQRSRLRRERLQTQTPIEALFSALDEGNFFYRHTVSDDGTLDKILLIPPQSIAQLRQNPDVLLADCTWKTNKYNKPILNLAGVTGSNVTIQGGLALLPSETEESYTWALEQFQEMLRQERIDSPRVVITDREVALMNAVEKVFDQADSLICLWHQNKDVNAYARKHIHVQVYDPAVKDYVDHDDVLAFMECYRACINADTEEEFNKACVEAEKCNKKCADYLKREWWPWKEKCVSAWTNKYIHFGHQSSSRLEGSHAKLKKWIESSRSDLYTLVLKLIPFWQALDDDIYLAKVVQGEVNIAYSLSKPLYAKTTGIIHRYPLFKTEKQVALAKKELDEIKEGKRQERSDCGGVLRRTWGLPCKHELMDILESGGVLLPSHFDKHWWIDRERAPVQAEQRIREPTTLPRSRRRGHSRKNKTGTGVHGTRREHLHSERVDRNHPASPPQPPATAPPLGQQGQFYVFQADPAYVRPEGTLRSITGTASQVCQPISHCQQIAPRQPITGLSAPPFHTSTPQVSPSGWTNCQSMPSTQQAPLLLSQQQCLPPFTSSLWASHQDQPRSSYQMPPPSQMAPSQIPPPSQMPLQTSSIEYENYHFFRAPKPPRSWGYVPYTSFGTHGPQEPPPSA